MELEQVQSIVDEVGASYFPIKLVEEITQAANRNNVTDDELHTGRKYPLLPYIQDFPHSR